MKPQTLETAAKGLWDENPELRASYGNNFQIFLETYALLGEWQANPQLRQEFLGEFKLFVAYKRHEASGGICITTR